MVNRGRSQDIPKARLSVKVQPRASRSQVVGFQGDVLRVRVVEPALEGRANAAVVELLARWLGVSRRAVSIVRGEGSRAKLVEVQGISQEALQRAVQALEQKATGQRQSG